MYYFAYGSNMAARIMKQWCSRFVVLGPARLDDYRLAFTRPSQRWGGGAADVLPARGDSVWGVLYEIDTAVQIVLDEKEGLGIAYQHLDCIAWWEGEHQYPALTYTVIDKADPELHPSPAYKQTLLEGALENGLPADYLAFLLKIEMAD